MPSGSVPTIDSLSKDERKLIVSAIDLKIASLIRAARAESDDTIRELRTKQIESMETLSRRFS